MRSVRYRIAQHTLRIRFDDTQADEGMLPSFTPFLISDTEGDEQPLTTVTVSQTCPFSQPREEVGQFEGGDNHYGVYTTEGGYQIEVSDPSHELCAVLESREGFTDCLVSLKAQGEALRSFGLNNCVMMAYAFASSARGTLLMHSSVIRHQGKGYLMTAPSGTGKSTHTWLWYKNIPGCDLINDDNPIVRILEGVPTVFGSPWSGKTRCYRNVSAPVGALVRIRQAKRNEIRRLGVAEAMAVLLPAVTSMKWDEGIYRATCDTIAQLIESTPVYELSCLPDADAARLCYSTIAR
ncbi:MAG: hypothetical protein LUI09_07530 [Prevotellaceae bacterium]|nr:hypothetical protein [Prevotellaceae bacterium]